VHHAGQAFSPEAFLRKGREVVKKVLEDARHKVRVEGEDDQDCIGLPHSLEGGL
jgi:hypothetical protein